MTTEQGLSLLDIGPASEMVTVSDTVSLNVYGISAKSIFEIFKRFPEIQGWFKGDAKINMTELIAKTPDALAAIIAAGCGYLGNEAAEEKAGSFSIEVQLDILGAIARLTFKNGFGPFAQRIVALAAQAQSVNYGRAQDTRSPPASKPSSPPDTPAEMSGD